MKTRTTIVLACAIFAFASCTKSTFVQPQQQYKCLVETWGDMPWYHAVTVPFTGTYSQMRAFEQSYYQAPDSTNGMYTARTCTCRPVITTNPSGPVN